MLVHRYELFKMSLNKSITDLFTQFTNIIDDLKSLEVCVTLIVRLFIKFLDLY